MERLAEEPIEDRAGRPRSVRRPHLAEDLALAGHERIKASGDAEEMTRRILVAEPVEGWAELGLERQQRRLSLFLRSLGRLVREIELGAVARGEADRFASVARERPGELGRALRVEGSAFA